MKYIYKFYTYYFHQKKRIFYNFDFATAHSTGFFLKRDVYKKIGLYDLEFRCSSDFDLYFRNNKAPFIK